MVLLSKVNTIVANSGRNCGEMSRKERRKNTTKKISEKIYKRK